MALAHAPSRLLEVHLFGEPRFYADGALRAVSVPPKAILLLCVLALKADQPLDRIKLAYTLWPDDAEDEAKGKLRRHLHLLGRAIALGDAPSQLIASNTTITWKTDGPCSVDVAEFERLSRAEDNLEVAVALYTGELLPNFYEEWLEAPRRRLRDLQLQNLLKLAERYADRDDFPKTLEFARAALRIDPWREDALRFALQARALLGDRSGAMQEYAQFVTRLREEFDTEPLPETKHAFESIKVAEPASTNLPLETTTFIGRQAQLQLLKAMLESSRMVTLTGPGGVGKSRAALHCARELLPSFADGAWLIQAHAECNEDQLVHAIAAALSFHDLAQSEPKRSLIQHLRRRQTLLLFDNVESFVDACAQLCSSILESCERVLVLATSREPLQVPGETMLRLSPFEETNDAVTLFNDRARAADSSFQPGAQHEAAVEEICRRVDSLPLAVELAAARVAMLTPAEILERLHDRFSLLKRARAPEIRHHQTLHATIAWSHELLSPEERLLFRRLAIFPSPCTLTAVEQVCTDETFGAFSALDVLSRLVDKSLVTTVLAPSGRRYRFLDSIREFALEKFYDATDADSVRNSYVAYYSQMADRAARELAGADQKEILRTLYEELDNIRAAMQISQYDSRHAVRSLDIACSLEQFWLIRGYFLEARVWLQQTLSSALPNISTSKHAAALSAIAKFDCFCDDLAAAESHEREAWKLRQAENDTAGIAESLHTLGGIAFEKGELDRARAFWQDSLDRFRSIGFEEQVAKALDNLGLALTELHRFNEARQCLDESFSLYKSRKDEYGMAWVLSHRAWLAENLKEYDKAITLHSDSLLLRRQLDDRHGTALAFHSLARCHDAKGEIDAAVEAEKQSIRIWYELRYKTWIGEAFENLAHMKAKCGEFAPAAKLLGAAESLRAVTLKPLQASSRERHEETLLAIRNNLGEEQTRKLQEPASQATLEEAIAVALGVSKTG